MSAAPEPAAQPEPPAAPPRPELPDPDFEVMGVSEVRHAATPTLSFALRVTDASELDIYTIALTAQIMIDPARRYYDDSTRERLEGMFGPPERWAATTHSLLWQTAGFLVPSFSGEALFDIKVLCTYDLELAAAKYFHSVQDGDVPMSFHFTGRVLYTNRQGRFQTVHVPWDRSARFGLPVQTWREMMDYHYPNADWARLDRGTLARLQLEQSQRGLPTLDALVDELLPPAEAGPAAPASEEEAP